MCEVSSQPVQTVLQLLRVNASFFGSAPALLAEDGTCLSHEQLLAMVERVVCALRDRGIRRGDRVVTVLRNGLDAAVGFLAASGCTTVVPLNPSLRVDDFAYYLEDIEPGLVLTRRDVDAPVRQAAKSLGIPVLEMPEIAAALGKARDSEGARQPSDPRSNDVALILHTSGTTARPKRVPLTQAQLIASAENIARTLRLAPSDRCLNVMPLFHIHGLMAGLLAPLRVGGNVVCTAGFDASRVLGWFDALCPTWYTAVPTIHRSLLDVLDEEKLERLPEGALRLARSSSSAMPLRLIGELEERLGVPVVEAYGMTEATHQVASNPFPPGKRKPGSVGLPVAVEVAILDPEGVPLPAGAVGEIALRGPTITAGYEDNPEANEQAFRRGWFRTGDEGKIDADGYLFLTGRLKEMINRGGEKVAPIDIDNALLEHPAVAQAIAFAVPHPSLGEDVAAAVVLRSGSSVTEGELRAYLFQHVAESKVPSRIVFVDAIPKGPTGKPQRGGLAGALERQLSVPYAAPETPTEKTLAGIWGEVLHVAAIGRDDNFFALGGDSLSAMRVLNRANARFGVSLGVRQVFDFPTLKEQAARLAELVRGAGRPDGP